MAGERVADDRVVVAPLVHEVGHHAGVADVDDLPGQLLGVVLRARRQVLGRGALVGRGPVAKMPGVPRAGDDRVALVLEAVPAALVHEDPLRRLAALRLEAGGRAAKSQDPVRLPVAVGDFAAPRAAGAPRRVRLDPGVDAVKLVERRAGHEEALRPVAHRADAPRAAAAAAVRHDAARAYELRTDARDEQERECFMHVSLLPLLELGYLATGRCVVIYASCRQQCFVFVPAAMQNLSHACYDERQHSWSQTRDLQGWQITHANRLPKVQWPPRFFGENPNCKSRRRVRARAAPCGLRKSERGGQRTIRFII